MIKSILLTSSSALALLGLAMAIIALVLALFKQRGPGEMQDDGVLPVRGVNAVPAKL